MAPAHALPASAAPAHPDHTAARLRRAGRHGLRALLSKQSNTVWWIGLAGLLSVGVLLRATAWIGLPAIVTADTDSYCHVLHTIETGEVPDLGKRNLGYPLFLLACKAVPGPIHETLPFIQQLAAIAAALAIMSWMRRRWGVLAALLVGSCILVNAGHAIWAQYAQPNALLMSIVPLAIILSFRWFARPSQTRLILPALLWFFVLLTRDEVFLLAVAAPLVLLAASHANRKKAGTWLATMILVVAAGDSIRIGCNYLATGEPRYSTHGAHAFVWRALQDPKLVAPPRPARLEEYYAAAAASGIADDWRRDGYIHIEGLRRVGTQQFELTVHDTIEDLAGCATTCVLRRPGDYARTAARDFIGLWLSPDPSLEWEAFRKSDPATYAADCARLTWASHAHAEFPFGYDASSAQQLFRRLAVLRPGQYFAMKPLAVLFVVGTLTLAFRVGIPRHSLTRWWFAGLVVGMLGLTFFYACFADAIMRLRMSMDWIFFSIAAVGAVMPLRWWQRRLAGRDLQ